MNRIRRAWDWLKRRRAQPAGCGCRVYWKRRLPNGHYAPDWVYSDRCDIGHRELHHGKRSL